MKKILFILILLGLFSRITFAEGLSTEEKQIIKDRITANDPARDLLISKLVKDTNGEEVFFVLPYLQNDPDPSVRAAIAAPEVLGTYGDASFVVPALLKAREDKSPYVRMNVAKSLLKRKQEKDVVPILLELIREGNVYNEMFNDIKSIKDRILIDKIKDELNNILNESILSITRKAYAVMVLIYVYNEPLTLTFKEIVIEAVNYLNISKDENDSEVVYRLVGKVYPRQDNKEIKKEDCLDILNVALLSKDKDIREVAERLINYIDKLAK